MIKSYYISNLRSKLLRNEKVISIFHLVLSFGPVISVTQIFLIVLKRV